MFQHIRDSKHRVLWFSGLSALLTAALIAAVSVLKLPNPNMILITALVFVTGVFGSVPGLISAGMILAYSLYFFSEDHSFVRFSGEGGLKVVIILFGLAGCYVIVSLLRRNWKESTASLEQANKSQERTNRSLEEAHRRLSDLTEQTQEAQKVHEAYEKVLNENVTFAHIAQALAADYAYLYYVNLETGAFIEFRSDVQNGTLKKVRQGTDFFTASSRDAVEQIAPEDRERFLKHFTKEHIVQEMDLDGSFQFRYRLLIGGKPTYVHLKATRMNNDDVHIIIGVSNVDSEMKQFKAEEQLRQERSSYARVMALAGNYICFYTVDPRTEHFREYNASADYANLGFATEGENFFLTAHQNAERTLDPRDVKRFQTRFTMNQVLRDIRESGHFMIQYRMMISDRPTYTACKAALFEEDGQEMLVFGVSNVDAEVRRELEAEKDLHDARMHATRDALTGVRNKYAYTEDEEAINQAIAEGRAEPFALVVMDVNNLKKVNDEQGHQAGDAYLQDAAALICDVFSHSPVYRVGGDEFLAIARKRDYEQIDALMERLQRESLERMKEGRAAVAGGMARFGPGDTDMATLFHRADQKMYEQKKIMKFTRG